MALVGDLNDLKLPSLIQLNCMERNVAKLTIEHLGKFGFIYFDKGQVVHAEYDPHIGEEAVHQLLSLYTGKFKVESGIRAPVNSIKTHWNNLLLEGLHQIDKGSESDEFQYDKLFERLLTVRGVQSVLILSKKGVLIASSSEPKENNNALFALSILEAEKFSEVLETEEPEFISIAVSAMRLVLTAYNKYYVVLELNAKIKLDVVLPLIKQALGI